MEKILLHCKDINQAKSIESLATSLNIDVCYLCENDLLRRIEDIVKQENKTLSNNIQMDDVLIFSNLSSNQLDTFLVSYRQNKIKPIALKAVVTEYNSLWTLSKLMKELSKENSYYQKTKQ